MIPAQGSTGSPARDFAIGFAYWGHDIEWELKST
jgi:hypothetical protein